MSKTEYKSSMYNGNSITANVIGFEEGYSGNYIPGTNKIFILLNDINGNNESKKMVIIVNSI